MQIALRRATGETVCERCVLADTALTRMRGLLGKRELQSGDGILLRPAASVHTAFMRFPIDVVFLDSDSRVLKIAAAVSPWKAVAERGSKAVLELPAGEAARRDLMVGDNLVASDGEDARAPRGSFAKRAVADVVLAAMWLAFAMANLHEWRTHHRPVGLGIIALQLMFAVLFFIRRQPWTTSRRPIAWAATTFGAWGMLAARPHYAPLFHLEAVWFAMQLAGAAAAAVSLGALGRSFGLVAANRGVRTGGPYRIVRHPAYAAYFFTDVGYALENPSVRNVVLLVIVLTAQLVRIRTEEDCLREDPSYRRYCERVRYRLVPLVW